jgi:hypothetical protein
MAKNSFFKHTNNEQKIVEDLTIESIQIHGQDMVYLPRNIVNKDELFGEDTISGFTGGTELEMYISNVDGFDGDGDFISKFGLEIKDSMKLIVSKKRFEQELAMTRPLEGDLIYFPLTNGLFEIKFVEHENPFYQLGKLYTYELSCELFQYSQEDIETGWDEIDKFESVQQDSVLNLSLTSSNGTFLVGEPVTATGWSANVVSWTASTNLLAIHNAVGTLSGGSTITGTDSGATGAFSSSADPAETIIIPTDPYDDSNDIQRDADDIFDFTDIDPFSDGGY